MFAMVPAPPAGKIARQRGDIEACLGEYLSYLGHKIGFETRRIRRNILCDQLIVDFVRDQQFRNKPPHPLDTGFKAAIAFIGATSEPDHPVRR